MKEAIIYTIKKNISCSRTRRGNVQHIQLCVTSVIRITFPGKRYEKTFFLLPYGIHVQVTALYHTGAVYHVGGVGR